MNKSLGVLLKENWIFIVVIGQFILTFGFIQNSVNDHEERLKRLENERISEALAISEINSRLSSIETSLLFIKDALK